jgi:hypothetical protein
MEEVRTQQIPSWFESDDDDPAPLSPVNSSATFTFGLPSPTSAKKPAPPNDTLNGNSVRVKFVLGKRKVLLCSA